MSGSTTDTDRLARLRQERAPTASAIGTGSRRTARDPRSPSGYSDWSEQDEPA